MLWGDNYSRNSYAYGSPTKWTVMIENKRVCKGRICPCTQTEEKYIRTYSHTVYLQDQTIRTPSLANPLIQTTPLGNPFAAPLHVFYSIFWAYNTATSMAERLYGIIYYRVNCSNHWNTLCPRLYYHPMICFSWQLIFKFIKATNDFSDTVILKIGKYR